MLNLTFEIYRIYLRMSYLPAPPPPIPNLILNGHHHLAPKGREKLGQ